MAEPVQSQTLLRRAGRDPRLTRKLFLHRRLISLPGLSATALPVRRTQIITHSEIASMLILWIATGLIGLVVLAPMAVNAPRGGIGAVLGVGLLFTLLWAGQGWAHEHAGIVYPGSCCNSAATSPTGDCAPIDDQYVTEGPNGYEVNLPVGAHPKLKNKGYHGVVPYKGVKEPISNDYHICLAPDGAHRFCFFPKPGTS